MSKTACWAFNDDTDCAMVHFGYPSRWDFCGSSNGYQLSKRALSMFLYYDFKIEYDNYPLSSKDLNSYGIYFEPSYKHSDGSYNINYLKDEEHKLSTYSKMRLSYLHIEHKDALGWFDECVCMSGRYNRLVASSNQLPLSGIEKVNKVHYDVIKRVYEINERVMLNNPRYNMWYGSQTEEYVRENDILMREWLEELDEEHKQTQLDNAAKWTTINRSL